MTRQRIRASVEHHALDLQDDELERGAHPAALGHMTAADGTVRAGHTGVKMRAIRSDGPAEGEQLLVLWKPRGLGTSGETQGAGSQASHRSNDRSGAHTRSTGPVLKSGAEILAFDHPDRVHRT